MDRESCPSPLKNEHFVPPCAHVWLVMSKCQGVKVANWKEWFVDTFIPVPVEDNERQAQNFLSVLNILSWKAGPESLDMDSTIF